MELRSGPSRELAATKMARWANERYSSTHKAIDCTMGELLGEYEFGLTGGWE